jgi:hypothetical protein
MNNKNNSNLEFRKIKSLKFLFEINENGTIVRNVKSKKQAMIYRDELGNYCVVIRGESYRIDSLLSETWIKETNQIRIIGLGEDLIFQSKGECARYLSYVYEVDLNKIRSKLKAKRSHIYDYDIRYL